jgi:predicted nucleotidyltransferase
MAIKERWKGFAELSPEIAQAIDRLGPLFAREGVLLAYLFGSLAQGRDANDVHLAVLIDSQPAYRLRESIVECLGTERVDIVDLHRASPVLRFEILSTGHCLYAADVDIQNCYELEALHLYRDTHSMRRRQEQYLRERIALWSSSQNPS